MRSIPARCFTAGLVLVLAISAAQAQGPPPGMPFPMGGPGGPGGPGGQPLVMAAPVQEDLGLTEKQKTQLKKLQASMQQQMRDGMQQAREGGVDPQEMMEGMNTLRREYEAAIAKVLDKAQKARLAQIELQREGVLAVAKSDIASKIKLTSPQSKKVKTIVDEMRQAQFRAMPAPPAGGFPGGGPPGGGVPGGGVPGGGGNPGGGGPPGGGVGPGGEGGPGGGFPGGVPGGGFVGGGFAGGGPGGGGPGGGGPGGGGPGGGGPDFNNPEFRAQMAKAMEAQKKIRDAATAKVGEILTTDQTAAFEKMTGKPFDFSKITPAPPPGNPPAEVAPNTEAGTPKKDAPAKTQPKTKSRKSQAP
jgi:Spy/CpxP family protein refolding chaperone